MPSLAGRVRFHTRLARWLPRCGRGSIVRRFVRSFVPSYVRLASTLTLTLTLIPSPLTPSSFLSESWLMLLLLLSSTATHTHSRFVSQRRRASRWFPLLLLSFLPRFLAPAPWASRIRAMHVGVVLLSYLSRQPGKVKETRHRAQPALTLGRPPGPRWGSNDLMLLGSPSIIPIRCRPCLIPLATPPTGPLHHPCGPSLPPSIPHVLSLSLDS